MKKMITAAVLLSSFIALQWCIPAAGSHQTAWVASFLVRNCEDCILSHEKDGRRFGSGSSSISRLFGVFPDDRASDDSSPLLRGDLLVEDLPPMALPASVSDPYSKEAEQFCFERLHMNPQQFCLVQAYVNEIISWNERVNLVSRRTCTPDSIFSRHIVPSLVCGRILQEALLENGNAKGDSLHIIDVGTGGGFPGIPLAILYPQIQFVLADSIGKKITAVTEMSKELKLSNVVTYNGRVEEYFAGAEMNGNVSTRKKFDVVTGRSVTSLPKFCSLVCDLLDQDRGHVVYLTGGDIDPSILQLSIHNTAIEEFLSPFWNDQCDKRVLIFPAVAVRAIADMLSLHEQRSSNVVARPQRRASRSESPGKRPNQKRPKGAWRKKNDSDLPKQRGYENFQRYASNISED